MKIQQDLRLGLDKVRTDTQRQVGSTNSFGAIVQQQSQKMQVEQLQRLLGDIQTSGTRLARSRTFKELARFKMLVKKFVKETVEFGLDVKQTKTWNQYGEGRQLSTVEMIDLQLIELTEDILNEEKSSIDLLSKIGEIKGLLINLYT